MKDQCEWCSRMYSETSKAPNHSHATGCLRVRCPGCGDVCNVLVEIRNDPEGRPVFHVVAADNPLNSARVETIEGVSIPYFWCESCQLKGKANHV